MMEVQEKKEVWLGLLENASLRWLDVMEGPMY